MSIISSGLPGVNQYTVNGRSGGPRLDIEGLKTCDTFSMRLSGARAEDAMVAAGAALAAGRPSVYHVDDRKDLPWFLREADLAFPGTVAIVKPQEQEPQGLAPAASQEAAHVDTFIGCLMSGLSETQYQEGRSHLLAIDDSLRRNLGSDKNACEGIQVASTTTFGTPRESLLADLGAVRGSDRCVFYCYDAQPRPSGMWVEAGAALALGKPSTFLVPDRSALPPALQRDDLPVNVRVVEYGTHTSLLERLQGDAGGLLLP